MKLPKPQMCRLCKVRPALFRRKGKVKADKFHDICQQCFRTWLDKNASKE